MSVVKINVLTVPRNSARRWRSASRPAPMPWRAPTDSSGSELLRPVEGTDDYLVYTRWRDEASFQAWMEGPMKAAHQGGGASGGERPKPAASGSTVWSFEVVQQAAPEGARRRGAPVYALPGRIMTGRAGRSCVRGSEAAGPGPGASAVDGRQSGRGRCRA